MPHRLIDRLSRKSRPALALIAISLLLFIGFIDYLTGPRVPFLFFYTAPVCLAAWHGNRNWGLVAACLSTLVWYLAQAEDPSVHYSDLMLLWRTMMALAILCGFALLTSSIADHKRVEAQLLQKQQSLEAGLRDRAAELSRANEILKAEINERAAAQEKLRVLNETLEQRVAERGTAVEERAAELACSEAAYRRQTSILRSILNSIADSVVVADAQRRIVLYNPAAERMFRTSLGLAEPDLLALEDLNTEQITRNEPAWRQPLLRAVRGEVVNGVDVCFRDALTHDDVWISITGRPLIDEADQVQGGVVVLRDITSNKRMEKQIAEISDREQCRIGQDLHDGLCQHLVGTAFASELLREQLAITNSAETQRAERISEMVNEAITQARQLVRGLYPVRLEVDGLASALEEMAVRLRALHNITFELSCDEAVLIHDQVAAFNLFRITQEAVNNAIKHARCKRVSISLDSVEDEITLTVKDDGAGIARNSSRKDGMGLHIMNYRAQLIGASLEIRPGAGGGTIVICSFRNEHRSIDSSAESNAA